MLICFDVWMKCIPVSAFAEKRDFAKHLSLLLLTLFLETKPVAESEAHQLVGLAAP